MAIIADIVAPGNTLAQYDAIMIEAGLAGPSPDKLKGLHAHYAWEESGNLRVLDIWESQQAFETNFARVIAPAAQRAGVKMQPEIKFAPLHNSIS